MLQRAGTNTDGRGPPVPDGPPVNTAGNKGFGFTQLNWSAASKFRDDKNSTCIFLSLFFFVRFFLWNIRVFSWHAFFLLLFTCQIKLNKHYLKHSFFLLYSLFMVSPSSFLVIRNFSRFFSNKDFQRRERRWAQCWFGSFYSFFNVSLSKIEVDNEWEENQRQQSIEKTIDVLFRFLTCCCCCLWLSWRFDSTSSFLRFHDHGNNALFFDEKSSNNAAKKRKRNSSRTNNHHRLSTEVEHIWHIVNRHKYARLFSIV